MFELDAVDLEKLIEAIDRSGLSEFSMVTADGEIRISKSPNGAGPLAGPPADGAPVTTATAAVPATVVSTTARPPAATPSTAASSPIDADDEVDVPGILRIRSPLLGLVYLAPEPGAPPFVQVGTRVEPDTTVAIIELMKVFASVQAGVSGTVREILIGDREFVEYDQALIVVDADQPGATG